MYLHFLNVIQADNLSLVEYIKESRNRQYLFIFSSKWQWLKHPFLYIFIPGLIIIPFNFVFGTVWGVYSDSPRWEQSLLESIAFFIIYFVTWFPPCVIFLYYKSFITPKKLERKITSFIEDNLSFADSIKKKTLANYNIKYKGFDLLLDYTFSDNRKFFKPNEFMVFDLHFDVENNDYSVIDKDGYLTKEFIDCWLDYAIGKDSCRNLDITPHSIIAVFPLKKANDVKRSIDELIYLPTKFHLIPCSFDRENKTV
jgi:hypothetical protein